MSHRIKTAAKQTGIYDMCFTNIKNYWLKKTCFYLTVQQLIKFHYVLMKYA